MCREKSVAECLQVQPFVPHPVAWGRWPVTSVVEIEPVNIDEGSGSGQGGS
jgi:hypothetical protein